MASAVEGRTEEKASTGHENDCQPWNEKQFTAQLTAGNEDNDCSETESVFDEEVFLLPEVEEGIKQLEATFDKCQTLLHQMKSLTVHVAGSFGEMVKTQYQTLFENELERRKKVIENKMQEERERSCKRLKTVRKDHKKMMLQMIGTVKTYFRRVMEDMRKSQRKELEEARKEGYKDGMYRQRDLLQTNLICSQCARQGDKLYVCSGCWSACYCGSDCQKLHWQLHEEKCGTKDDNEDPVTSQVP